jgi:excisionase family DNA binding protein
MRRASSPPSSDWLTTVEVAALLRVHPKHVYRLLHQGMPARRVGGQWRFSRDAIRQWADERGDALCADSSPAADNTANLGVPLVAVEPNEVSDVVIKALAEASGRKLATVSCCAQACVDALGSGEVVAAIVRQGEASKAACATVRISLGSRPLGVIAHHASQQPRSVAIPPCMELLPTRKDLVVQRAAGELEACTAVLRREVDAALGSEAWARRFGLLFEPLTSEPWELAVRVDAMEDPAISGLCVSAQGDLVRQRVAAVLPDAEEHGGKMRLESGALPGPAQLVAADDPPDPAKPSQRARSAVRWTILLRERAEQMLNLVDVLRSQGVRVGGFLQVPSGPASAKPLGYDLYRLLQPERMPLAERIRHDQRGPTGERSCELTFHAAALVRACEWLREDASVSDVLVVDGVGKLEERGQGLFPALAWARMQVRPKMILLSSRWDHVPQVTARLALTDRIVTELAFGSSTATPPHVIDHILLGCGKKRRSRTAPRVQ